MWAQSLFFTVLLTLGMILSSCGNGQFSANSASDSVDHSASSEQGIIAPDSKDSVAGGKVEVAPPNQEEREAIKACHKSWGKVPPSEFQEVRKIFAAVSVLSDGLVLQDFAQTSEPMLTIIHAGVNVGGNPVWQFANQNGWYCIVTAVNVATNLTVRMSRNARLADSKVSVRVGSNVDGEVSAIGVHVGSNVNVEWLD